MNACLMLIAEKGAATLFSGSGKREKGAASL
jgi:hypothetical protein